jgi:hypothetical protein
MPVFLDRSPKIESWLICYIPFENSFSFTYELHQGTKIKESRIQHYRIKWVPLVLIVALSLHGYREFYFSVPPWRCDPTQAMASSLLKFLDHTQRRTTVDRTPLDERSVRCRDLYLITHNTHDRHPFPRQASGRTPTP